MAHTTTTITHQRGSRSARRGITTVAARQLLREDSLVVDHGVVVTAEEVDAVEEAMEEVVEEVEEAAREISRAS